MARSPIGLVITALVFSFGMAACSGMSGGNGSLPGSADVNQTIGDTADALLARRTGSQNARAGISAANALGGRIRQLALVSADDAWMPLRPDSVRPARLHSCEDGIELMAPARNGAPNSTEALVFYDAGCSQLALDDVRTYTPTSAHSETVHHATTFYVPGNSRALGGATATSAISNATFGRYGLPNVAAGFANVTAAQVVVNKSPELSTAAELVMMPGTRASATFCSDSAGYDPSGIVSLDSTFGWQGSILSGGTRTSEGNGFVTWSATPAGTVYGGATGALSIASATQNLTCPIARPDFTLAGGSAIGTYTIPISVTFHRGRLWGVTVSRAMLPGGDTLSVRTNHARRQSSRAYITGTIKGGRTSIATFGVNAFGNGTLTVTSTGAQYKIADWIVAQ
ncbi:MAG TPA: hypothetical protein VFE36_10820 [Candidatus Baltobacteraceae bacterium]|jgi:hypothetical protein|nr:hypothetical protein [Candidatus Baltobacteraceae bacterium]